jgi:hypothetical protein
MAYFMLASAHKKGFADGVDTGLWVALAIVVILELNALFGKQGPMASVVGVIHSGLALTAILGLTLYYI